MFFSFFFFARSKCHRSEHGIEVGGREFQGPCYRALQSGSCTFVDNEWLGRRDGPGLGFSRRSAGKWVFKYVLLERDEGLMLGVDEGGYSLLKISVEYESNEHNTGPRHPLLATISLHRGSLLM